jgi:hypothetical protein
MSSISSTDTTTILQPSITPTMSFDTTIPFDHLEYQWRLVKDNEHVVSILTAVAVVALTWFLYTVGGSSYFPGSTLTISRSPMLQIYHISREFLRSQEQSPYLGIYSSLAMITLLCARSGGGNTSIPSSRSSWGTREPLS